MRCISVVRSLYFKNFSASFLITFLSPEIATSINVHVPFSLSRIITSGLLLLLLLLLSLLLLYCYDYCYYYVGWDSGVDIATCHVLNGPGIDSQLGATIQTGPRAHIAHFTMRTGSLSLT
jgi:hypothetical protein